MHIKAKCISKMQDVVWPEIFAGMPVVGDTVIGLQGEKEIHAHVMRVSHTQTKAYEKVMQREYFIPLVVVHLKETI